MADQEAVFDPRRPRPAAPSAEANSSDNSPAPTDDGAGATEAALAATLASLQPGAGSVPEPAAETEAVAAEEDEVAAPVAEDEMNVDESAQHKPPSPEPTSTPAQAEPVDHSEEGNDAEAEAAALQAEADATAEPVKEDNINSPEEDNQNDVVNSAVTRATSGSKPAAASVSRVAQLEARVAKDPLDGEAQLALLADAEAKGDLERTREVYENFLKIFPEQAAQWIKYCELELSHNFFDRVEQLFARCLLSSPSVQLWRFYLDYIRRINPIDPSQQDRAAAARATITKSFEFALQHVGQDRRAGEIWMEYITFLRTGQGQLQPGGWEDQQRMDALRRAFHRAVQIPLNAVELIWQEYVTYETQLNKMTAKKFQAELSPAYMEARKVLRELKAQFDELISPSVPRRPNFAAPGSRAHVGLDLWRKYLAYEQGNPLAIEDPALLANRVAFAFKQAIAQMRFYPEVWYLNAAYLLKQGRQSDAEGVLKQGMGANPSSALLAYTLAELKEAAGDTAACYVIYDSLIERLQGELKAWEDETEKEVHAALAAVEDAGDAASEEVEVRQKMVQDKEDTEKAVREKRKAGREGLREAAANVWIAEIRFARRAEGVKPSRALFSKARKTTAWIWQLAVATANLELLWNKETKVATNIFELGFKVFASEPLYVLEYLNFLIYINDHNNARALFERTVALLEPEPARPVWDRMAQFEFQYGDFLAVQKMAKRFEEAFPETTAVDRFAQRYGFLGLEGAITKDLGWRPPQAVGAPVVVVQEVEAADVGRGRERSASPAPNKRARSVEPQIPTGPAAGPREEPPHQRMRVEGSPAPSSQGDRPANAWGRAPLPTRDDQAQQQQQQQQQQGPGHHRDTSRDHAPPPNNQYGSGPGPEGPPGGFGGPEQRRGNGGRPPAGPPPGLNRPTPYVLDTAGDNVGVLPDAVVFFLSILPPSQGFNGPMLNPATMVDVIGSTILPGTAPGPGLPGERLGVPPRPKPAAGGGGGGRGGRYGGRY